MVLLGDLHDAVGVYAGIEIHGCLDGEDDAQNGPLFPGGITKAKRLVGIFFLQLDSAIFASGLCATSDLFVLVSGQHGLLSSHLLAVDIGIGAVGDAIWVARDRLVHHDGGEVALNGYL